MIDPKFIVTYKSESMGDGIILNPTLSDLKPSGCKVSDWKMCLDLVGKFDYVESHNVDGYLQSLGLTNGKSTLTFKIIPKIYLQVLDWSSGKFRVLPNHHSKFHLTKSQRYGPSNSLRFSTFMKSILKLMNHLRMKRMTLEHAAYTNYYYNI